MKLFLLFAMSLTLYYLKKSLRGEKINKLKKKKLSHNKKISDSKTIRLDIKSFYISN